MEYIGGVPCLFPLAPVYPISQSMNVWRHHSALLAIVCLFAPGPGAFAQERAADPPLTVAQLFARGYELLRTSPSEAIPLFEEIVRRDSASSLAQRQLGSLYL